MQTYKNILQCLNVTYFCTCDIIKALKNMYRIARNEIEKDVQDESYQTFQIKMEDYDEEEEPK